MELKNEDILTQKTTNSEYSNLAGEVEVEVWICSVYEGDDKYIQDFSRTCE
jgi:hypothetical protein